MWNAEQIIDDNTRQLKMEVEKRLIFCALKQIIDLYSNYFNNVVQKIRIAIQTMRSLENHRTAHVKCRQIKRMIE